jgi:hypothetical protein
MTHSINRQLNKLNLTNFYCLGEVKISSAKPLNNSRFIEQARFFVGLAEQHQRCYYCPVGAFMQKHIERSVTPSVLLDFLHEKKLLSRDSR